MNDDLISRRTAIDDAHRQIWYRMNPNMKERIDKWLENLPSAQPEQKTFLWGKQILIDDGFGGKRVGYICPACKEYVPNKGNYCSNCGAKMVHIGEMTSGERSKMTLDDAIKLLTQNYKIAQKHEFIAKPLSWALYHTWDEIDKKEKRRKLSEEDEDND